MDEQRSAAFGRGSDARIAGTPYSANPYRGNFECFLWWNAGWRHAHHSWSADARWPVRRLPDVAACAAVRR